MSFFANARPKVDVTAIERVRGWVRMAHNLDDDATISVTELHCSEPDCPPIETAITIMRPGQPVLLCKIHKSVASLEVSDVFDTEEHQRLGN